MFAKSLLFCSALTASSAKSALDAVIAAAPSEGMKSLLREHSRSLLATSCEYDGDDFSGNTGTYTATASGGSKYDLSICKPLVSPCVKKGTRQTDLGACMCQTATDNLGKKNKYIIASWTKSPLPTWEESKDGNPQLTFQNGATCYSATAPVQPIRKLLLEFVPGGKIGDLTVEEITGKCTFVAKFSGGGGGGLSDGSIILIVLFVSLILYCVIGVVWRKKKRGATGKELIPNLEFWTGMPGLVKDGFKYFVSKTCKRGAGGSGTDNYDKI